MLTYSTINIPIFMMNIFYLIEHFYNHEKSNNSRYNIYRHYLNISSKVDYYYQHDHKNKIDGTHLKKFQN